MNVFYSFDVVRFTTISAPVQEAASEMWSSYHHPTLDSEQSNLLFKLMRKTPEEWEAIPLPGVARVIEWEARG